MKIIAQILLWLIQNYLLNQNEHKIILQSRSSKWPKVREEHLKSQPECQACGTRENLNVHHILPFHTNPEMELDPNNLITLCESKSFNCHYGLGHGKNWMKFNPNVIETCEEVRKIFN